MNNSLSKDVARMLTESISVKHTESFPRYQTPFVDYMRVKCKAGNGGSPLPNVNRSRRLNGPGYGGHGGDIILRSTHLVESLLHLSEEIRAKPGGDASGTSRGLHASHTVVNVPIGLIVRKRIKTENEVRSVFWHQFIESEDCLLVARGGKGGLGPSCFKKHDNRLAEVGETTDLELELRLSNDVALIGLPNSGKTSLLSALTPYMTRIGPEEGSTTRPHVAVVKFVDGVDIRVLDLPPLCPHSKDKLERTLRHIYRSKLIVYVIDAADPANHMETLESLREAVTKSPMYSKNKFELVIMTKCDKFQKDVLFNLDRLYYKLLDKLPHIQVVGTSATHRLGLERLVKTLRSLLYPTDMIHRKCQFVSSYETKLLPKKAGSESVEAPTKVAT